MSSRNSDRWLTPGVIITALLVAGAVISATIGAVAYLTARGIDPSPLLKLSTNLVGAVGAVGTLVLQLAQRAQNSKTERNTGVLAGVVDDLAAVVPAIEPAAAAPATAPAPYLPAARHYDVDDPADDDNPTRVAVPAVAPLPPSLRRRRTDQL